MALLHRHWLSILIRGVLGLLFGLIAIFSPNLALVILITYFGIFVLINGILAFIAGISTKSLVLILESTVGILVGLYILNYPQHAAVIFIILVGVWALVTGVLEVLAAIELQKYIANEFLLLFGGILSILFSILIFMNPQALGSAVILVIGFYSILFGLLMIGLGLKFKNYQPQAKKAKSKHR